MKSTQYLALLVCLLIIASCEAPNSEAAAEAPASTESREFYQLKTYTFDTDQQVQMTDQYLKDAFLPGLKRSGIRSVGVFKSRPSDTDTIKKTWVLLPFTTLEQFLAHEEQLAGDEAYLSAGAEYLNAPHDQPPYRRIESVLMRAFTEMPSMDAPTFEAPRSARVYELRSYESATEADYRSKVDMFNAGGEVKLFDRLEFNAVFYAEVLSGSRMPNLMYMTTFPDRPTRDTLWKAFFASPEWEGLKAMPQYQNNVSHADIFFLYPTEYSDY